MTLIANPHPLGSPVGTVIPVYVFDTSEDEEKHLAEYEAWKTDPDAPGLQGAQNFLSDEGAIRAELIAAVKRTGRRSQQMRTLISLLKEVKSMATYLASLRDTYHTPLETNVGDHEASGSDHAPRDKTSVRKHFVSNDYALLRTFTWMLERAYAVAEEAVAADKAFWRLLQTYVQPLAALLVQLASEACPTRESYSPNPRPVPPLKLCIASPQAPPTAPWATRPRVEPMAA